MKTKDLTQIACELSSEQQTAVREFIDFVKERQPAQLPVTFQAALDNFISAHPELLRRLAQ